MNLLTLKNKVQIKQAVEEFKQLKDEQDYDKIKAKYFELFGSFPITVQYYNTSHLKHLPLYRARHVNEVIKYGKEKIESYMGPPKNLLIGNGRANWNGRNVFYAGDSPFCSVVENKKIEIGEEYFVGKWEIDVKKISEDQVAIAYLTHKNLSLDNPWNAILPSKEKMIETLCINKDITDAALFVDLIEEISTLFSDDNEQYTLSAFIADNLLYSNNNQSFMPKILIYPSIASEKISCNIAIHPDFAKTYLRLIKVAKIKITEKTEEKFQADFNALGQLELGKIQYYHFNFDREKATYKIDNFGCGCGVKFRIKDPEKLMLEQDGKSQISLRKLLDKESLKWVQDEDLLSYSEGVFSNPGIAHKKIIHSTIPLPNTIISRGGKEHNNLYCNIIIEQPFSYIKEGSTKYLSIANGIVNY